jgi:hypothetical protein
LRFTQSIQYLLKYPYGCLEQTTSSLLPLLYYNDIARIAEPGVFGGKGADYFINEGILKLTGMSAPDGGFYYWPDTKEKYNTWASIYASHFLVEARKAGYFVSDNLYRNITKFLKKTANDPKQENNFGTLRIYAAYVLALAGKLDQGTLAGLKLINLDRLPSYSKFQYAGAIAITLGPQGALWLLPTEVHPQNYEMETGGFFNSSIRANAILLDILNEITPQSPSIPVLARAISEDLYFDQWYTTQGTAWGLMAIGKYMKSQEKPAYTGAIVIDGKRYKDFGVEDIKLSDGNLAGGDIEISINGQGNCYYYWQASGVPSANKIEEYDDRLRVRREYLDYDGNQLDQNSIMLGGQIITKITVQALDKDLDNVVINDLLPSCLEIENPRLETSGQISWLRGKSSHPDYLDIRDDRFLMFAGLRNGREFSYYYSARVICSGDFQIPPIAAECMYDPTIRSAGSSGRMIVSENR